MVDEGRLTVSRCLLFRKRLGVGRRSDESLGPRHRWQFTIRSLLVVMLGTAIVLGLLTYRTRSQRLASEVRKIGGTFCVEEYGPDVLRRWLGRRFGEVTIGPFDRLSAIELGLCGGALSPPPAAVTDEWLENLAGQEGLCELGLSMTDVTDEGITRLRGLQDLRVLRAEQLRITDRSLEHLATFVQLEELWVGATVISSQGIRHLRRLPQLRLLVLRLTEIDDSSIPYLEEMNSLEYLDVRRTKVTREGRQRLERSLPRCLLAGLLMPAEPVFVVLRHTETNMAGIPGRPPPQVRARAEKCAGVFVQQDRLAE